MQRLRNRLSSRAFKVLVVAAAAVAVLSVAGSRRATATDGFGGNLQSWVSGFGDDANPCSRTAPCKTWQGAFPKTSQPGGVIEQVDPGNFDPGAVNLGQFIINGGITIDGGPGGFGNMSSAFDGIDISAAPGDVIVLRNIELHGGGLGVHGINFISGKALYIENSVIEGFTGDGIHFLPAAGGKLVLDNVSIRNNGQNGVNAAGSASDAMVSLSINGSHIDQNALAGILASDYSTGNVDGSTIGSNAEGLACVPQGAGSCSIDASHNLVGQNTIGVQVGRGSVTTTGTARATLTDNTIVGNGTGLAQTPSGHGQMASFGDNVVIDNTVPGKPTSTIAKV